MLYDFTMIILLPVVGFFEIEGIASELAVFIFF
jgi:hypothetical protein